MTLMLLHILTHSAIKKVIPIHDAICYEINDITPLRSCLGNCTYTLSDTFCC